MGACTASRSPWLFNGSFLTPQNGCCWKFQQHELAVSCTWNGEPKCVATVYHRPVLLQNEAINNFILFIYFLFVNSENVVGRSLNLLALKGPQKSAFGSGCSGGWRRSGFAVEHEVNALLEPSSELLLRPVFGEVEPARMHTGVIYMWLRSNPHLHTTAI